VANKKNKIISAKDISATYSITYQTVNHYTDLGLLPVAGKKGNARFYNNAIVGRRLKEIKDLAREGYSLRLIRKKIVGI
jgi:DNA-binding transcriptional MerR regulator